MESQKIILLQNTFENCFAIKEGGAFLSYNQGIQYKLKNLIIHRIK